VLGDGVLRFGLYCPTFGEYADPKYLVELAVIAEESGWDGFFIWDHILLLGSGLPVADAITTLAAIAAETSKITLGPMVTPIPRRRPWKLAKELITLDHLTNGRILLGAGIGNPDWEYTLFGENPNLRTRAQKLDEGLEIISQMCSGKVEYNGKHYAVQKERIGPRSLQKPRIPVWIAGTYGYKAPLKRASRWDGVFPLTMNVDELCKPSESIRNWSSMWLNLSELSEIMATIAHYRGSLDGFDVANSGSTLRDSKKDARDKVKKYEDVGASWWLEWILDAPSLVDDYKELIERGPPR
jgi:alkanesulfonate monooxygenase SsuD/methylene tetrahydromethanopterin reductase-like flavin-dependent oxidoreductase (luciferase family)